MWLWWSHTQRCYGCHVLLMRELNACVFCFFSLFQFSNSNVIIHSPTDGVPITRCRRVSLCIFEIASVCQCSVFVAPRSYCPYAVFKHSRACTQTHTPHNAHLQHNTHTRDTESDHIIYCAHVQISHSCALNRYHHTRHANTGATFLLLLWIYNSFCIILMCNPKALTWEKIVKNYWSRNSKHFGRTQKKDELIFKVYGRYTRRSGLPRFDSQANTNTRGRKLQKRKENRQRQEMSNGERSESNKQRQPTTAQCIFH